VVITGSITNYFAQISYTTTSSSELEGFLSDHYRGTDRGKLLWIEGDAGIGTRCMQDSNLCSSYKHHNWTCRGHIHCCHIKWYV